MKLIIYGWVLMLMSLPCRFLMSGSGWEYITVGGGVLCWVLDVAIAQLKDELGKEKS